MNNSNLKEFSGLMVGNGEIYNKVISKNLMSIYFNALRIYSIEDIKTAFSKHAIDPKSGQFFPKPADIVRHTNYNQLTVEAKAEMAWSEILHKVSTVGSYDNLEMDDKQALATVRALGGWKNLCRKTTEHLVWMKKEFISIYQNYENTPIEMLPNELPGRMELEQHKSKSSTGITMDDIKARINHE